MELVCCQKGMKFIPINIFGLVKKNSFLLKFEIIIIFKSVTSTWLIKSLSCDRMSKGFSSWRDLCEARLGGWGCFSDGD